MNDYRNQIYYIDLDPDELVHWKYIKREKLSNGKYRYYYKDDAYDKAREDYHNANVKYNEASMMTDAYRKHSAYLYDQLNKQHNGNTLAVERDKSYQDAVKLREKYASEKTDAAWDLRRKREMYMKAHAQYNRSAGHKVADFLNGASDMIDKAKKWLIGLFKR